MKREAITQLFDNLSDLMVSTCTCGTRSINPDQHKATCPYKSIGNQEIEIAIEKEKRG